MTVLTYNDIDNIIDEYLTNVSIIKNTKKVEYFNIPCAFDIETTSTEYNKQKVAFMYCWQMCLNGAVLVGRRWEEFDHVLNVLHDRLNLSIGRILIIYVHNLSFEFQFIRKRIEWVSVFSLDEREPVKALSTLGIEFRCSYKLSGYSLAKLGDNLKKYKVGKMVGDLNYNIIRTEKTPMTEKEIQYCVHDVLVVCAFIQERIEQDGNITKIPLTKTGYVRNTCRKECLPTDKGRKDTYYRYRRLMQNLTLTPDEYIQLKRAYAGGFTHANAYHVGEVCEKVGSFDFTSSYPAVMVAEKYPMSKAELRKIVSPEQFRRYLKNYCCLFDVEFTGVIATSLNENPLSLSKCWDVEKYSVNNGRIVFAEKLKTTMTEQDFFIFRKFYKWDSMKFGTFRTYRKAYLPKELVNAILTFYEKKTTLKGVDGKEVEYMQGKENVNSVYGMMVTDICRDEIIYENDLWGENPPDIEQAIELYNNSVKRFLFYPWGVWVTAYARKNLFTGIYEFGDDYRYSDTDSIKAVNYTDHAEYIKAYNEEITEKISKCLKWHKIPLEKANPKTINGEPKPLGVWDFEGEYERFKTLGAKRYMTYKDGKYNITVSGLNKSVCVPYILNESKKRGETPFDFFCEDMYIPPEFTGKNTHTYIDDEQQAVIVDCNGTPYEIHELSSVHITGADYHLSLASDYINYLKGVKEKKYV